VCVFLHAVWLRILRSNPIQIVQTTAGPYAALKWTVRSSDDFDGFNRCSEESSCHYSREGQPWRRNWPLSMPVRGNRRKKLVKVRSHRVAGPTVQSNCWVDRWSWRDVRKPICVRWASLLKGHCQPYLRTGHVIREELKILNLDRLIHSFLSILVSVRHPAMKKLAHALLQETSSELLHYLENTCEFCFYYFSVRFCARRI